jgi:hypothetical protein
MEQKSKKLCCNLEENFTNSKKLVKINQFYRFSIDFYHNFNRYFPIYIEFLPKFTAVNCKNHLPFTKFYCIAIQMCLEKTVKLWSLVNINKNFDAWLISYIRQDMLDNGYWVPIAKIERID